MNKKSPRSLALILLICASPALPRQSHAATRTTNPTVSPAAAPQQETPECKQTVDPLPARGGSVDWGLALSGGGIRSGSFSVGVLKALYDLRLLDHIDAISSVSGGGYASYWLLSRYDPKVQGEKFGDAALKDDRFLKEMCGLQLRGSEHITKKDAWKMLWSPKNKAFTAYREAIERTFGDPQLLGKRLNDLRADSESGRAPYFIFNTTLKAKNTSALGRVFELTPVHMGNPVVGFCSWEGNSCGTWRLNESAGISESVAISGAAIRIKWGRTVTNDKICLEANRELRLSDGGHSENLGALALIRRGVQNVIIVDAVHDHKYKFEEYKKLRNNLRQMGIKLSVKAVDKYLKDLKDGGAKKAGPVPDVSEGTATSAPDARGGLTINSRVFYIKLSLPTSEMLSEAGGGAAPARMIKERQGDPDKLDCSALDGLPPFRRELYALKLNEFMEALSERGREKLYPDSLRTNFPQIPTADQRFAPKLTEALVALGYLKTLKLAQLVKADRAPTLGR